MLNNKFSKILLIVVFFISTFPEVYSQEIKSGKENETKVDTLVWNNINFGKYNIKYTDADNIKSIKSNIDLGIKLIETYFDKSFKKQFTVNIFPNRGMLDRQWQKDWNIPSFKSECWMVASGVADKLDLLNPADWEKEACEHDASNPTEVQKLIAHELVHVYHGQNNVIPDFNGLDDIGWFIEGLATLVSGQLDKKRLDRIISTVKKGNYPKKLKNAWSGPEKYGISGSMVNFIKSEYGKEKIIELLAKTNEQEILAELNTTEDAFIKNWKTWILSQYVE